MSIQNVDTLLFAAKVADVYALPEFIQLMDDDIVSLTALTLIVDCRDVDSYYVSISQLALSLYLMTQCQLKLRHSVTSLADTLDYIDVAYRKKSEGILHRLTLKFIERKLLAYITTSV